jgi:hypothetical protein
MIKRLTILIVIVFCQDTFLFSQMETEIAGKKNQFFVKSIVNQINVGYTRSLIPAISLSFEGGYQLRYLSDLHYKGSIFPVELLYRNLAYSGLSVRFSPNFNLNAYWTISPLVGYQNLYTRKIIFDPGASGSGSDDDYSEYSQRVHEIIAQVLIYKQDPDIPIQFYFGLGMRFQHLYNAYSIDGTVHHKTPSDRKEDHTITYFPSIIIGLKFIFVWF